ncbi:MAG: Fe-S assembly protein IscX [Planctomycetes bacterium]|nr:Fe-S assembly protein IscX [Planctomycetota bacterium]NOG52809.1 Fe-S cluster assembly protein IscX [Planctomycetota bacterium]
MDNPNPNHHQLHWLDVEEIAEELAEAHPDVNPMTITFPRLKELVESLPGFKAQPGHPCNERILETIQGLWIEEKDG